jgi:hypothetical protein
MIRGVLCEDCNGRLSWVERDTATYATRPSWVEWFVKHTEQIRRHLLTTTEFRYEERRRYRRLLESESKVTT